MKTILTMLTGTALGLLGLFAAPAAYAADVYPNRPITMIVPYGAGGGTDVICRVVSAALSKALGQAIVVEPRPGANGAIGSRDVARAPADGYTLLSGATSAYAINPSLMKDPLVDQNKDLVPFGTIGRSPWLLGVQPDSPFHSVADVIAYAKANPNKLAFGHWQSSILVTGSTFARVAGIQLRGVPYRGAVETTTDFLGGRLPLFIMDTNGAAGPVAAGQLRLLATFSPVRVSSWPDLPTLKELGLDVVTDSVLVDFAPAHTPRPVLERLNAELSKIIASNEEVRARIKQLGIEPAAMTLDETDAFVRSEIPRWADLIQKAGLQKE